MGISPASTRSAEEWAYSVHTPYSVLRHESKPGRTAKAETSRVVRTEGVCTHSTEYRVCQSMYGVLRMYSVCQSMLEYVQSMSEYVRVQSMSEYVQSTSEYSVCTEYVRVCQSMYRVCTEYEHSYFPLTSSQYSYSVQRPTPSYRVLSPEYHPHPHPAHPAHPAHPFPPLAPQTIPPSSPPNSASASHTLPIPVHLPHPPTPAPPLPSRSVTLLGPGLGPPRRTTCALQRSTCGASSRNSLLLAGIIKSRTIRHTGQSVTRERRDEQGASRRKRKSGWGSAVEK